MKTNRAQPARAGMREKPHANNRTARICTRRRNGKSHDPGSRGHSPPQLEQPLLPPPLLLPRWLPPLAGEVVAAADGTTLTDALLAAEAAAAAGVGALAVEVVSAATEATVFVTPVVAALFAEAATSLPAFARQVVAAAIQAHLAV